MSDAGDARSAKNDRSFLEREASMRAFGGRGYSIYECSHSTTHLTCHCQDAVPARGAHPLSGSGGDCLRFVFRCSPSPRSNRSSGPKNCTKAVTVPKNVKILGNGYISCPPPFGKAKSLNAIGASASSVNCIYSSKVTCQYHPKTGKKLSKSAKGAIDRRSCEASHSVQAALQLLPKPPDAAPCATQAARPSWRAPTTLAPPFFTRNPIQTAKTP
jgi:hypothetical protein